MATKYEYFDDPYDSEWGVYLTKWYAQTFTPSISHVITSVKLLIRRDGSPGILTAAIYPVNGNGKPDTSGAALCSGTTEGNSLTTGIGGEWRKITLGAGSSLTASIQYAIVLYGSVDDENHSARWKTVGSGGYAGGEDYFSLDSGSSWIVATGNRDLIFEEWGDGTGLPTVTTQAVTSIVTTTATGNGNVTDLGDSSVTEHGHCWNTGGLPDTDDSKTTNGSKGATGTFTSSLTSLTSGTLYYVRAYATNTDGTAYGDEVSFTAGAVGGELRGLYAIVEERFHYVDAYGIERALLGEPV